uniref:Pentatricopeptide repeat-containing protein n=1 Tax=Chenopodium quinoa TaxID=63459 RepID=A0A803MVG6_CHEQI
MANSCIIIFSLSLSKAARFISYVPTQKQEQRVEEVNLDSESILNKTYWTRKIHKLCAIDGNVDEALCLLDSIRVRGYCPDSLNLSSIIHALCWSKRYAEAHQRFLFFIASQCIPDVRTCNVLIAKLLDSRTPHITFDLVRSLIKENPEFVPSLNNYNRLIDQFCKSSEPHVAHRVLFDMVHRGHCPTVVSYTTLINGYCKYGEMGSAFKLFNEMFENNVVPNSLTYSVLLGGVLGSGDTQRGKDLIIKLWEQMKNVINPSVNCAAFSNLMDSLCRVGLFHEIFQIAEDMPQGRSVPEEFVYAQMVDSLCRVGRHHGASRIAYIMRKRGFTPSKTAYNSIIHGLSKEGGCMRAFQLFQEGIVFGYVPSEYTYKILVESLCLEGDVPKAKEVLQSVLKLRNVDQTRIYNIYIRALCLINNATELLNTLVSMLQAQCKPDVITLNTVTNGLCKMGRIQDAMEIFYDMMLGKFCAPDAITFTVVIGGLLNAGKVKEALVLLHEKMPERQLRPSVVTYNAVLRGLFNLKKANEAMEMYRAMVAQGLNADSTTYSIVIDGLCEAGRLDDAKRFWDEVIWPSQIHDNFVYASILKGLCQWGRLDEACDFLYELVDCGVSPNIYNYNILIDCACKLGLKKQAYQIVGEMRKNGLSPDAVTWRILDKLHRNFHIEEKEGKHQHPDVEPLEGRVSEFNNVGSNMEILTNCSYCFPCPGETACNCRELSIPTVVLKTRRSLHAFHLHLHASPFLLTAEVNGLDSSDSSMTLATSQGMYDIHLLLYMLLMFMLLIGLAQLPLMSLPILIWPPLSGNNGRISFQHSDGNAGSSSLKQRFGPSSVRLLSSCCLPLNLVTFLRFRMKYGLCQLRWKAIAPEFSVDVMKSSDVQPEERNTRFFPVGDPAY